MDHLPRKQVLYWSPRRLNKDKHLKQLKSWHCGKLAALLQTYIWLNNFFNAANETMGERDFFLHFLKKSHRVVWLSTEPPGFGYLSHSGTLFSEGTQLPGFEQSCYAGEYQPFGGCDLARALPSLQPLIQSLLYSTAAADLLCKMHTDCPGALKGLMSSFVASPTQESHE